MAAVGPSTAHVLECELLQACKSTVLILINGKRCLISAQTHKLMQAGCWEVQQGTAAISPSLGAVGSTGSSLCLGQTKLSLWLSAICGCL